MVGIHYLEIKEGYSKEEAINIGKELFSEYNNEVPDVRRQIAEVDRGEKPAQLAMFVITDDVATRNSYWPGDGLGASEKWLKVAELPAFQTGDARWAATFDMFGGVDFVMK